MYSMDGHSKERTSTMALSFILPRHLGYNSVGYWSMNLSTHAAVPTNPRAKY